MRNNLLIGALSALVLVACSPDESDVETAVTPTPETTPTPAPSAADYSNLDLWLCHPDKDNDVCEADASYTVVSADSAETVDVEAIPDPAYDCFYIYPTISMDAGANSDLTPGEHEEIRAVSQQFAPFKDKCRQFAPLYRQLTLAELASFTETGKLSGDLLMRYLDVKAAWEDYLANDNEGRGVVLIGHSQGAAMIQELLAKHINNSAEMDLIISAYAIGYNTPVAPDGSAFNMGLPLCTRADQAGCMVSWVSFREDAPPPAEALFGQKLPIGVREACVNPAVLLESENNALDARLPLQPLGSFAPVDYLPGTAIETSFVSLPGMLSATCKANDTHDWLAISVSGNGEDTRLDDIPGDVVMAGKADPNWGLHLVDMNIALGDIKALMDRQSTAWTARHIEE
ncbi:MAG: lysophospholipase [Hirschia sp.]|nr:lysophospholipase [Hirschia sp.]MBF18145.1 lysophospholipase [Hirschia sp.]MBF19689.1 lysophospholipase [Hirschia sp.]